jgi:hypothetical protein
VKAGNRNLLRREHGIGQKKEPELMNTDLPVASSLIQAINNGYVPSEDESAAEEIGGFQKSTDRRQSREIFLRAIKEIDNVVEQVEVRFLIGMANRIYEERNERCCAQL